MAKRKSKKSSNQKPSEVFWNQKFYQFGKDHEGWLIFISWIFLFIGIEIYQSLFHIEQLPLAFRDVNLLFPIFLNIYVLIGALFSTLFYEKLDSCKELLEIASNIFMYMNAIFLVLHLFGYTNERGHHLPSLLSMMDKPIWFAIAQYVIFFCISSLIFCWAKYWSVKRKGKC